VNGGDGNPPNSEDPLVRYFAAGQIHDVGQLELRSGETLYIEAGAVVRGNVFCSGQTGIRICGRGILDGNSPLNRVGDEVRSIVFDRCRDVVVEDIVMIEPRSWMLVLGCCENVRVTNLRQIGSCISSDGIDICGSRNVVIEGCCLRNEDDNIAIKAVGLSGLPPWQANVSHVRVNRCTFLNGHCGNAMEIGYELCADRVEDVVFEDIDVINAHGEGAVFSIHNGDRATVENIQWKNIRVEHYWDKLIDFRVVYSRYNRDPQRGRIRNVLLSNIKITQSAFNAGCSISLVSGYSAAEPVSDILIKDVFLNQKKVACPDDLDLHMRNAENIRFA
jgi:hypothetical protein